MREGRALDRERRMDPQVAVDLARLLELDRPGDVSAHAAAVPAVERASVDDHDQEVLRVRGPDPILVLDAQHAGHRRTVRPPEPNPAAIVGGQHACPAAYAQHGDATWVIL